jgi:hypothetical protein
MLTFVNTAIDRLQRAFPPNRIVVLLTPLLFVPAAGFASASVAQLVPGVQFDPVEVTAVFVAGAAAALAKAYKWLDGWQRDEARKQGDG